MDKGILLTFRDIQDTLVDLDILSSNLFQETGLSSYLENFREKSRKHSQPLIAESNLQQAKSRSSLHTPADDLLLPKQQQHADQLCCITSCVSMALIVIQFPVVTVWLRAADVFLHLYAACMPLGLSKISIL